jgi:hypothetical protein
VGPHAEAADLDIAAASSLVTLVVVGIHCPCYKQGWKTGSIVQHSASFAPCAQWGNCRDGVRLSASLISETTRWISIKFGVEDKHQKRVLRQTQFWFVSVKHTPSIHD